VADFNLPCLRLAPQLGVIPFEFRCDLWHQKTKSLWAIVRDPKSSLFDTLQACDGNTDRDTDRHMHDDSIA